MRNFMVRFVSRTDGATTVTVALSAIGLLGAVGLAVDVQRLQSTQQGLQRAADGICGRIEGAPLTTYPTSAQVVAMAQGSAATILAGDGSTDKSPSVNISVATTGTNENYTVTLTERSPSTFGSAVGYSGATVSGTQTCTRSTSPTNPPPGSCTATDAENYVYAAGFNRSRPPVTISAAELEGSSDQKPPKGYVATILNNQTGAVLSSSIFNGDYQYSAPANASTAMTLYIQDLNVDGTAPPFCSQPLSVPPVKPPPVKPPPHKRPPSCDWTIYNHETKKVKVEPHDYWGSNFQILPNPNYVSPSKLPADVVVYGVTKKGYTPKKITLSEWFTPNKTTMVNFNNGGSTTDATGQDDYLYNAAIGRFHDMVDTNGDPVGAGASTDGASPVYANVHNKWRLVHVINGTEAVWEDVASGECFQISSPIALDLPGLGQIATTGVSTSPDVARVNIGKTVSFDLGENNHRKLEWLTGNGQGFLVDNRDGRAVEDMSMERLFGANYQYTNGYEKLASFDHSGTGVLRGEDLEGLAVWIDDGDGVPKASEIVPLSRLGVTELSTRMRWVQDELGHGHMRSLAVRDGKPLMTEDVWLGNAGK